jgi:hypothetical protein
MSRAHRLMHRQWAMRPKFPTLTPEELDAITTAANHRTPGSVGRRWVKRRRRWTASDDHRYQRIVWRDPRPAPDPRVVILDRVAMPTFSFLMGKR